MTDPLFIFTVLCLIAIYDLRSHLAKLRQIDGDNILSDRLAETCNCASQFAAMAIICLS